MHPMKAQDTEEGLDDMMERATEAAQDYNQANHARAAPHKNQGQSW